MFFKRPVRILMECLLIRNNSPPPLPILNIFMPTPTQFRECYNGRRWSWPPRVHCFFSNSVLVSVNEPLLGGSPPPPHPSGGSVVFNFTECLGEGGER